MTRTRPAKRRRRPASPATPRRATRRRNGTKPAPAKPRPYAGDFEFDEWMIGQPIEDKDGD